MDKQSLGSNSGSTSGPFSGPVSGWIIYKGFPYHKGLHRFIEKQVSKWLKANTGGVGNFTNPNYRIVFDQEGPDGLVGCRIEIRVQSEFWLGLQVAKTAHEALTRGLQRLKYVSDPDLFPSWAHPTEELSEAV